MAPTKLLDPRVAPTIRVACLLVLMSLGLNSVAEQTFASAQAAWTEQRYDDALQQFEALALDGDARAQAALGMMYENGQGVTADLELARKWYTRAANAGLADAQHDLGVLYYADPNEPDYGQAAHWWQLAAANGVAESQFNLALLYQQGLGVTADPKLAQQWFGQAAAQDLPAAVEYLAEQGVYATPDSAVADSQRADPPTSSDVGWILNQDPEAFTVQIATGTDEQAMRNFLHRENLGANSGYFSYAVNGVMHYTAITGIFADRADAVAALALLSPRVKRAKPWIRQFAAVQTLLPLADAVDLTLTPTQDP